MYWYPVFTASGTPVCKNGKQHRGKSSSKFYTKKIDKIFRMAHFKHMITEKFAL